VSFDGEVSLVTLRADDPARFEGISTVFPSTNFRRARRADDPARFEGISTRLLLARRPTLHRRADDPARFEGISTQGIHASVCLHELRADDPARFEGISTRAGGPRGVGSRNAQTTPPASRALARGSTCRGTQKPRRADDPARFEGISTRLPSL